MSKIVVAPQLAEQGVVRFLKEIKRVFFFFKKIVLTYNVDEALDIQDPKVVDYMKEKYQDADVYLLEDQKELRNKRFYVIVKNPAGSKMYYTGDDYVKLNDKVRKTLPVYKSDIMEADFFKSMDMTLVTLNRIRQSTDDNVIANSVFLTERNDYTIDCVVLALRNKQTRRLRYLKSYNLDGKPSDRLAFVDSMEKAMKVTIPMANSIYEDIHQKHKMFEVMTAIYDGNDIPASKFKNTQTRVMSDFKFKKA